MLTGSAASDRGRVVLIVTTRRVAPGLLSWPAWRALRDASRVLSRSKDHPQVPALAAAGISCQQLPDAPHNAGDLAALLAGAAGETSGSVVWLTEPRPVSEPPGDEATAVDEALRALPAGPATEVVYGAHDLPGAHLIDLVATMDVLRTGCPWDAKQTHQSLAPHLLEEPYEALEALESGDHDALREELGDVLLQVVFHAKVASERGDHTGYTVDDVADGIVGKLVRRHPHVFGDVNVSGADEVKRNWDAIKRAERAEKAARTEQSAVTAASVLDGVPFAQPALALAAQLQRRATRAGAPEDLVGGDGGRSGTAADTVGDLGDRLLLLVAQARRSGLDPELELRAAARRFRDRVSAWERAQPAPAHGDVRPSETDAGD